MAIKFNNKDVNSVLLRDGRVVNKVQILNGTVVWRKNIKVNLNVNSGVQSIEYKIDSNAATVITSSTQIEVPYESKLYVKAVAKTGYSITGEASKTFASITDAQSWGPSASLNSYTLTITDNSSGISRIIVTRTASSYAGAPTGTLSTNSTIYYGDTLIAQATLAAGYHLTNTNQNLTKTITVTGSVVIKKTDWPTALDIYTLTLTSSTGLWSSGNDSSSIATAIEYVHYGDKYSIDINTRTLSITRRNGRPSGAIDDDAIFTASSKAGYTITGVSFSKTSGTIVGNDSISATTNYSANNYTVTVNTDADIKEVNYKIGTNAWQKATPSSNKVTFTVQYGVSYSIYGSPVTGCSVNNYYDTNHVLSATCTNNASHNLTSTRPSYIVTLSAVNSAGTWKNTSGSSITKVTCPYGSTVTRSNNTLTFKNHLGVNITTATFTATSKTGHSVSSISYPNLTSPITGNYIFSPTVNYTTNNYNLSWSTDGHCSVTVNGTAYSDTSKTISVAYGTQVTMTPTAYTGYSMATTTQTFTMPAQNVSKTFTTTVNTYKVSWTTSNCSVTEIIQVRDGDTSETISLSSGSSVKHGSKLIFKLKANSGYTMNGGTSQTFIVNGASLNLQFTASINYYSLTVNKGTGVASTSVTKVSGSQDNSGKWSYGSKVNITASPSTGYQITSGTGETTITSDKIVNVTASKLTYQVSYTTSNCSVTLHYNNASGSQISSGSYVEYGTVVYVKASPNTGYTLDGSYNGTTFTVTGKTTKTYTATKIKYRVAWTTSNCSVTLKTSGGTTISNGSSYDYGTVINVTATANTGYTMNSYSSQFTLTSDSYKALKYTASANKRQFKINVGTGVSTVYYKVAGGSQYSTTTTKTIDVYYGQSVEVYGVAKTGYNAPNYHSGNKYILNSMPNSNQSVTISATIAYYTVNFQCVSHPNGGNTTYCSWNKSSISVPYGTTYYRSGDKIIFSNGTQVIFNYPADSSGVDFSVTYNGVSTSSQSITASKTITAVVRTIYY